MIGRCLAAAALLAAATTAPADTALEKVRERGVLSVAVYEAFPPFSSRDEKGRAQGIDVDIARELARRLGTKASIRFQPADESVEDDLRNAVWKGHYIGGGVADVMLHVPADPRFTAQVDQVRIDGVYYMEDVALAFDRRRFDAAPALPAFEAEKIGVEIETISDLYLLSTMNGRLRDNVVHYRGLADATAAMVAGKVAAVMGHRAELQGLLKGREGFAVTNVLIPGVMISSWPLGVAVKAEHTELADAVMGAMRDMVDDGTVSGIFANHGATRTPLE